jgi:hypothetical protein
LVPQAAARAKEEAKRAKEEAKRLKEEKKKADEDEKKRKKAEEEQKKIEKRSTLKVGGVARVGGDDSGQWCRWVGEDVRMVSGWW